MINPTRYLSIPTVTPEQPFNMGSAWPQVSPAPTRGPRRGFYREINPEDCCGSFRIIKSISDMEGEEKLGAASVAAPGGVRMMAPGKCAGERSQTSAT